MHNVSEKPAESEAINLINQLHFLSCYTVIWMLCFLL